MKNDSPNVKQVSSSVPADSTCDKSAGWLAKGQRLSLKKGLIVALLIGVVMAFLPAVFSRFGFPSAVFIILVICQIAAAVAAILFINKNLRISMALLAVFVGITLYQFFSPGMFRFAFWGYDFDSKYLSFCIARIVEMLLAGLVLIALNQAWKPLSIIAAALLLILDTWWIVTARVSIPGFIGDAVWGTVFVWTGYYVELLVPVILLICAINPHAIHNSIFIIDGYFAIRLVLFIAGDLLAYGRFVHDLYFLINLCWMPLMLIFGLNAVLLFPVRFKELAKVFGLSLLAIAVFALLAGAQQSESNSKGKERESRQDYMNKMRDNILSWKKAGFSDNFTTDAALQMYKEGRITAAEYNWLIRELIGKG